MAPPSNDLSLYYLLSVGIPLLACALLGRFVSWWLALAVWEGGAAAYLVWRQPWRKSWGAWRNIITLLAVLVYGITFFVGRVLEKVFPRIVEF